MPSLSGHARNVLLMILACGAVLLSVQAIQHGTRAKTLRTDAAHLNDAQYGLLDAGRWAQALTTIAHRRLDAFEVTPKTRPELRAHLANLLERLITEVEAYERRRGHASRSLWDRLSSEVRQTARDLVIDFDDLRTRTPEFADAALDELSTPEAKAYLKTLIATSIRDVADTTFSAVGTTRRDAIVKQHGCADVPQCTRRLATLASSAERALLARAAALIALAAAAAGIFVTAGMSAGVVPSRTRTALMSVMALSLLAPGIALPMIQMEAKISSFELTLLGEPLTFANQVLFFQSKSIIDVMVTLVQSGQADLIFVALLVGLFSVVFPLIKLGAGLVYLGTHRLANSKVVQFFALRSGKWSMADVMVVTMLMSFVGFRGILDSQLDKLDDRSPHLELLTTNGTSLEVGFFVFLAYCLYAMALAHLTERPR